MYDRGIYLSYAQRRDELLARLDHPNIVRVLEKGEIEGRLYTALEYVDGSLDKRLRDGPLPVSAAASVARAVVLALQHLRERRIVHINLRPAAILLTSENVPKLLELDNIESVETSDEKRYKSALGSGLGFAAPEELVPTDRCSTNVDVYRVGALLYAMLASHAPFAGDPRTIISAVLQQPPPAQFNRALGDAEGICLKCLEKRPEHRYVSLQDLAEALARIMTA